MQKIIIWERETHPKVCLFAVDFFPNTVLINKVHKKLRISLAVNPQALRHFFLQLTMTGPETSERKFKFESRKSSFNSNLNSLIAIDY